MKKSRSTKVIILSFVTVFIAMVTGCNTQKPTVRFVPPVIEADNWETSDSATPTQCFRFDIKNRRDSMVYITEYTLEYGWNNDLARIIVKEKDYNAVTDIDYDTEGNEYVSSYHFEQDFIEGTFEIKNNKFIFTPDQTDKYPKRTFNIQFVPQSEEIEHLTDADKNIWTRGECFEAQIGIM